VTILIAGDRFFQLQIDHRANPPPSIKIVQSWGRARLQFRKNGQYQLAPSRSLYTDFHGFDLSTHFCRRRLIVTKQITEGQKFSHAVQLNGGVYV
jgi:hypothetical protein